MEQIKNLMPGRAAIVKPRSVLITTRYFWQKWRPLLGNSLAILIMETRRRCYRNLATGEVRNWFYSTIGDLAKSAGFSSKKVLRLLKLPLAAKFIRYKSTYIYSPELGKKVRGKCLFKVLLDDPLIPEDEVSQIGKEIHKNVSFQSPPKPSIDCQAVSLEIPPAGQVDHNKYSTFQDINIEIKSNNQTYSQIGGIDDFSSIFQNLKQEIARQGTLAGTIIESCSIAQVQIESDFALISIDAPNNQYRQVLEVCLSKKIIAVLKQMTGRAVSLQISDSSQKN